MNVLRVLWLAAYTAAVPGPRRAAPRSRGRTRSSRRCSTSAGSSVRRSPGSSRRPSGPAPTIAIDAAHVPAVRRRDAARPAAAARRGADRARRTSSPTSARASRSSPGSPRCAPCIALWTTTSVISAGLTTAHDLLHHDRPRARLGGRGRGAVGVRARVAGRVGRRRAARVPRHRARDARRAPRCSAPACWSSRSGVPVPVMVAAAFVAGAVNSNILVAYITMRTLLSPDALLGRVGATARTRVGGADADRRARDGRAARQRSAAPRRSR